MTEDMKTTDAYSENATVAPELGDACILMTRL